MAAPSGEKMVAHVLCNGGVNAVKNFEYRGVNDCLAATKVLAGDALAGMIREIREEAGIECTALSLRGTVSWPGFGKNGEDWLGFVFLITAFEGTPYPENPEGPLEWVPMSRLAALPMWEGDRFFLPLVFDGDPRPFHGVMPYKDGRPVSWQFTRM